MSGTNRLINSIVTKQGGSNSVLTAKLMNANVEAIKADKKKK